MTNDDAPPPPEPESSAQKATTLLAGIAGATFGLLASIATRVWVGESYPTAIGNGVGVAVGAFVGMSVGDLIGPKALKPLAFLTGMLILSLGVAALMLFGS